MDTTIDQQVEMDEALVPHAHRLRIGRSYFRLLSDISSKESTLQLVYDVLHLTPFFKAFLVTADVLEIYMQELWATATVYHHFIRFKMDKKKHIVNLESFREMLHICPRLHGQSFVEPPFKEEILNFLRFLGYSRAIRRLIDVNINKLHQPWRSFAAIINKCLIGKSSGYDSLRLSQAQILWGLYHKRNVDFAYLMWENFAYQVKHKDTKKSNEMYYPRFTKTSGTLKLIRSTMQLQHEQHHLSLKLVFQRLEVVPTPQSLLQLLLQAQDCPPLLKEDEGNDEDDEVEGSHDEQASDEEEFIHSSLSTHVEEETSDEESFDPIPKTPKNTNDEGNGEENLGMNVGKEEGQDEEDEEDKLYRDFNINLGRGIQMGDVHTTQEFEDTHVTLTPVNPDCQQQSSSVSSQFVTSLLNLTPDAGVESIFKTTSQMDVQTPTSVAPLPVKHKDTKKSNEMYYPMFTKVIIHHFMSKDPSIPSRNKFGAMLPIELTNADIRNSEAYKEYYAVATGATPPKPKASIQKTRSSSNTTVTPPTAAAGPRLKHISLKQVVLVQMKELELAEYINTPGWNRPAFYNNGDDDDEDCTIAITSDFLITDSLIMGDEHLDTIPEKESDKFNKSSVKDLVPNPSEFEDECECDVPGCDDSQTTNFSMFSNPLFDDEESSHEEDIHEMSFKTYSNPLFDLDEEIISSEFNPIHNEDLDSTPKNDRFDTNSYLLESSLNHDTLMISSLKIDSLLAEFVGELIFLESIPPGVDEANCDPEEYIHLVERLLYDNSSPRPPEEFVSKNSNANIESFFPSPIPNEDSDSFMEEIDLFLTPDDPMPPSIEDDDDDSERDILILEELIENYSLSLTENESFRFDIPSFSRPPAKPLDGNTVILNIKMMGYYFEQKVKDKQEKDKIGIKPDKNEKHGKARQCQSPITNTWFKQEVPIAIYILDYMNLYGFFLSKTMDMTIDQQVALDEALVSHASRLRIEKSNFRLKLNISSKESTLQLVYDVLRLTPFFKAFLVTADVPNIYMQEFWATATVHHHSIRFKMDNKKHIVNLDNFGEMLHICPRLPGQTFDELTFKEEILAFLRFLGHSGEIRRLTDVIINKLHQPWRSFIAIINKCLSGKTSGYNSLRLSQAQILWGLYHRRNVDFAYLMWEYFVYQVEHKDAKKSNEMYYPVAIGATPPKTKASVWKTQSSSDTTVTPPPSAVAGTRLSTSAKGKQPAKASKAKSLTALSEESNDDDDQDSDEEGKEFIHPRLSIHDEDETKDEESFDPISKTLENIDDEGNGEENLGSNIGREEGQDEEDDEDELYRDVNINLEGRVVQMDDVHTTQEFEDSHVTLTPINPDGQQQSSSMDVQAPTTVAPLLLSAPTLTPSTIATISTFAGAVSSILGIAQRYMDQHMNEAVKVAVQIQSDRLHDEALAENEEFLKKLDENIQKIIKEQTSYAVAADLSEMELKKILIKKLEGNKSIHQSNKQRNLYKALVEAYESDKIILDTCGDTVKLKRRRDDDADKDEEPSARSDRGSKRRREGKEPESASDPKEKATRTTGKSKQGSKSRQMSVRESATTEKPIQTTHEITVHRDDEKLYKFKEGDFKRLRIQDIEDMLLLLVQGKLTNLMVKERFAFNKKLNLTRPDTYRSDLKRKEAYTAYSNPRGFIYQNKDKQNRLMRIDELHKFSDGTLTDVLIALDNRLNGIRMKYLPQTIWRKSNKERAAAMIQAIDKQLKMRRIMRSLERFVGGRLYEGDFKMLQRTI
nr:hypothetical protein [Tanacetum cinerariifolium]